MSWLARSIVNTLRADHGASSDDDDVDESPARSNDDRSESEQPASPSRGVKEDLSELTQTLTRQFWGVASFLAPPPSDHDDHNRSDDADEADELPTLAGIRSDLAEIGGRVRSGISVLSSNKAVTEISKIASTLFGSEEEEDDDEEGVELAGLGGVGVSEEVLAFVRNVSMHPETWLDFPLLPGDDFNLSDAQEEHALAMEQLAPSLAALRAELCPGHMSEDCFWKIYFVLLHPKLNKHDAELLTTPQIVQARATLLQDLPIRRRMDSDLSGIEVVEIPSEDETILVPPGENVGSSSRFPTVRTATSSSSTEFETDKHPVQISELQIIEKSVIEEEPKVNGKSKDISGDFTVEEDGDEWLEDEPGEVGVSRGITVHLGNEEDVSFSDLEADDDDGEGLGSKTKSPSIGSPTKEESGWVQLNKSSEGAARSGNSSSPEWLDVDIDVV